MSLEAKIEALTNAVTALTEAQTEHTERLNAVLAGGAKADDGETKTTRKPRAKKTDTGEGDDDAGTTTALTHDGVKKDVGAWLGQFANNSKDPETQARKEKIKGTLAAMQKKDKFSIADEAKGVTIADVPASELHRIITWLDKQKAADNGFGAGRLTEAPGADKADADDSDDI